MLLLLLLSFSRKREGTQQNKQNFLTSQWKTTPLPAQEFVGLSFPSTDYSHL